MEDENNNDDNGKQLRSLNSDLFSYAIFISRTIRRVDIVWLDYAGKSVKYNTLEAFGEVYPVTTYVTHPWVFRDADTGDHLLANGQDVFFPEAWSEDNDTVYVYIDIPVYTLLDRCLQQVTKLYTEQEIKEQQLPPTLKVEFRHRLCQIEDHKKSVNNTE